MPSNNKSILVVGGGAAGILSALRASQMGATVTLLEKNSKLGMKILISGGGHCNITHDGDIQVVRRAFRPNEARFLAPAFHRFTNRDICEMLSRKGVATAPREDGRIFPVAGSAHDVMAALKKLLQETNIQVRLQSPVSRIQVKENSETGKKHVCGVYTGQEFWDTQTVILCVGGSSYPGAGTTGDGWAWARECGHTIIPLRAALAPIYLRPCTPEWAGVALRACALRARQSGKLFASWEGDLLFTHRGVSGPCALGISREIAEHQPKGPVQLEVDLLPKEKPDELSLRFRHWLTHHSGRKVSDFIRPLLPERLLSAFLNSAGCDPVVNSSHLPKTVRNHLLESLKGWNIGQVQAIPLEKGEVVAGGISLDEVNSQTMESRIVSGLYLAGEVLDIAGPIGGYNLQAAWSTGWVAGEAAACYFTGTMLSAEE